MSNPYCRICPECGSYVYEPDFVPEELRNAALFNRLMQEAQRPSFPTGIDKLRMMDDDALADYIMELAKQEYVRGFFHIPSMAEQIHTWLKEKVEE